VRPLLATLGLLALLACAAEPRPAPAAASAPEAPRASGAPQAQPAAAPFQSWREPAPAIETGPVVEPARLHVSTLPNGLRMMVLEDHRLPRFGLGVVVRRGAASETPAQAGLATFLADLVERGAGDRDALALAEAVDGLGASFGASADWDTIGVHVGGLTRDLDALFPILADLVLRPRLEPGEAQKVRAESLASLERAKDQPRTLAAWHLARAVYGDHRYGFPLAGTPETVASLDAEQARAFHESLFRPGNAILYASGDVDPADLVRRAEAAFGAWPAAPVPDPGPAPPLESPAARRIVVVDRPDLAQTQIVLAHEGITRTDPDRIAAVLMNSTLGGGGFSSRLMTVVREREGLAYGIHSGFRLRRAPGPFVVGTATRVAEARRALDLILAELARIREQPPTAVELGHAQTYAVGHFALGLETSAGMLASLLDLDVYGLPPDGLDTYRARVAAVTPEETAEQARRLIHPERAAIVLVGPAKTLVPALEGLGPVEVVQP